MRYEAWKQKCNATHLAWLRDYVEWHREVRHKPDAEKKYLGYSCLTEGATTEGYYVCQGLGDRTRGTMFLFRVAAMTKRILVIKQNHPAPLEEFLKPSGILDWMTHDITEPVSKIDIPQQFIPHLKNGTAHELPHKYILWMTNGETETDCIVPIRA
ncbi:hypothetical protein V8C86DRAFT_1695858 [Haematococcus lacustris]